MTAPTAASRAWCAAASSSLRPSLDPLEPTGEPFPAGLGTLHRGFALGELGIALGEACDERLVLGRPGGVGTLQGAVLRVESGTRAALGGELGFALGELRGEGADAVGSVRRPREGDVAFGAHHTDPVGRASPRVVDEPVCRLREIAPELVGTVEQAARERVGNHGPRTLGALGLDRSQVRADRGEATGVAELLADRAHGRGEPGGDQRVACRLDCLARNALSAHSARPRLLSS